MDASPVDRSVGAFSDRAPWIVDPAALTWRRGLDDVRRRRRAEVPRMLEKGHAPPVGRIARTVWSVGLALGGWYLRDRRTEHSRAGLSARLRRSFEQLGSTYVKLGQIVSGGEGLFPPELVSEFKLLRDRVPPEAFSDIRSVVEADLGASLHEIFERFDTVPVAAASIAQVHAARLRTGEDVVVKVQRPQVARLVAADIRAMSWLAPLLVGRIPVAALANPPALVELFAETISEELDFRLEAENMLDIARVLAETAGDTSRNTIVPRPHPELVTRRVLVMERLDGFAWDDVVGMQDAGVDTEAVLHEGMVSFMEGAMLYGVFHGDLHGGNLLVRADGTTVLLDFGITGRLDQQERMAFLWLLVGATNGDVRSQLRALRDLGAFPPDTDLDAVFTDLGLDRPPIDPTKLEADELVRELQELTKKLLGYGARAPKELMLFVKNLMFLDGAIATLAPDLDILGEIQKVHTEITIRHGDRLARELGIEMTVADFDPDSVKAALGLPNDIETLTHRDVQERREIIRKRMEDAPQARLTRGERAPAVGTVVDREEHAVPEMPEMQALAERIEVALVGARLEQVDVLGFSALKTVVPAPESFLGSTLERMGRRGKYLAFDFAAGRILVHLSQAGRLDVEAPPKRTRGKGSVVRLRFDDDRAVLVREYGHERKAAWWVLASDDDGPLAKLGPEPDSDEFAEFVLAATDKRRIHTWLRDQRTVAGIGRGYADDSLHRAKLSPTATLPKLEVEERRRLLEAIRSTLADALAGERTRVGGLSAPKLGDRFTVHGRPGTPCPVCGDTLRRVSYESYEITYCPTCQTGGKVLADRRMSRLVK